MSTEPTPALARATEEHRCTGCGRAFATARGLAAHRSAPFQTMACKRPAAPTPANTPPALVRATEALDETLDWKMSGEEWKVAAAPHVLSAALHDPDGALARTLCRRIHRSLWPVASAPDPDQPGCANCREHVSVLRAAILGIDQ